MWKLFKNKNRACPQCLKHGFCRRGFTLLETLVAIAIFSVSLLGVLSLMASSITSTTYAKNKIIAGYLAQEGLEYMRNLRDTYVLYDTVGFQDGWSTFETHVGLTGSLCADSNTPKHGCYIGDLIPSSFSSHILPAVPLVEPIISVPITACNDSTCSNGSLLYDSSKGAYVVTSNSPYTTKTSFTRQITVAAVGGTGDEVQVTSTVYWKQGSGSYNIKLSENLYNWVTKYTQ
jgi:prepilin-type N-terminal cleavage/methylation domain-containing protein